MTEAVNRSLEPLLNGVGTVVRFNVPRERLSESTVHAILKIVRELVMNAIRHGRADEIQIAGTVEPRDRGSRIVFSVRDNGGGFDPASAPGAEDGHFGLVGIRERLRDFGGEMRVESAPGSGTRVSVYMQMKGAEDE